MSLGVQSGQAGYNSVGKDRGAVAARQATPVHSFAEQKSVLERVVVVRGEKLVPLPGIPRNDQRNAAHADPTARRPHPERGVLAAEEELGARWRLKRRLVAAVRRRARGDDHESTRDGAAMAAR